jgi:DNA-binding response OmpR family regulator
MNKILVINNDMDSMKLLKQWLESKNYLVKITTSRKEVPGLMREFMPEIVMADIMQKETVNDLKENENTRGIPILLMSGYSNGLNELHLKVDDIIEKPFNLALLEVKLKKLLKIAV